MLKSGWRKGWNSSRKRGCVGRQRGKSLSERKREVMHTSAVSRLSIVLLGLVVASAFLFSSPSPTTSNVSISKPDTSQQKNGLNTDLVTAPQTGPNSELPRPVKKFSDNARTAEIEFFSFEFERPYL